LLDDSDYTATNGTSITGLAALVAGQTLYIETWDNVMSLGTMAAQDANAVAITGGTLAGITSINAVTPATAQYTTALDTKLGGIEAAADVTDATNVTAAGALMDSELTDIAAVKALDQGVATTDSPTFVNVTATDLDGILGSNTPAAATVTTLTASTGASGATADAVADEGVFEGSGNSGISILTPSANYGSLHFRNPTDGLGALINHINGTGMTIATAVVGQTMVLRADNGVDNLTLSGASGSETATFAGTLSAGATTVTTLTASDDVNLANTKSITFKNAASTVRDIVTLFSDNHLYIDNQDGDIILRNGTPSLTLAASGAATFAGTLSAQATDVTTLTASGTTPIIRTTDTRTSTTTGDDLGGYEIYTNDADGPHIAAYFKADSFSTFGRVGTLRLGISQTVNTDAVDFLTANNTGMSVTLPTTFDSTLSAGATDVTTLTASGNAAINTTLPTLNTIDGGLVVGSEGSIMCFAGESNIGNNFYFNSGWKYRATGDTSRISYGSGNPFIFQYAPSGAADSAITFQTAGTINSSGNWDFGAKTLTTTGTLSAGATTLSGTLIQASSSTSKTTNSFKNTETANVAAHSAVEIVSGGPSGGDPQLTFTIPSIGNWSIGMDNSNSDLFTIGNSNSLGTNTALTINSSLNATFAGTAEIQNGVYIGGSAAANLLDDYEEGTWTPAISGDGTAGTYTNGTTQATYTKIGRMVTVNFGIGSFSTATGGTGNLRITGLPFTKTAGQSPTGSVWFSSVNTGASVISLALVFSTAAGASATLNVNEVVDNAVVQLTPISGVGVSSQIHGSITYFV
jgi:trimeric autotransporter adhesin